MTRSTFADDVAPHLTLENARAWAATDEKWCFIDETILTEIDYNMNSVRVAYIEERLEALLKAEDAKIANLDPRIGVLNGGVFYAFVNGPDQPEVRGTREEVEIALGIRPVPAAERTAPAKKPAAKRKRVPRKYEVTLTFQTETLTGRMREETSTVEIIAYTAKEALSTARRNYRDEQGRYAETPTYRARRMD